MLFQLLLPNDLKKTTYSIYRCVIVHEHSKMLTFQKNP
jgi:hypothetical protein